MPEDLPLEPDLIKVLASDTRREILRRLRERSMTTTELARDLDLGKATVHEHLNKLAQADLVQRREDDRLWVYYEISPKGKRMLNPQRTRFYLIVAVSAVAGLVALVALALFLSMGGPTEGPGSASSDGGLAVQLADGQLYTGGPARLEAVVPADGVTSGQLEAYLVPADQADDLRSGDPAVRGYPLSFSQAAAMAGPAEGADAVAEDGRESTQEAQVAGPVAFEAPAGLPPGAYVLYVRGGQTDNAADLPSVRVSQLGVHLSQTTWYQQLSPALNITVERDGAPIDGRLTLEPTHGGLDEGLGLSLRLVNGTGQIQPSALDGLAAGTYRLEVLPEGADRWQALQPELDLQRVQLSLVPAQLTAGDRATMIATLTPAGAAQAQPTVLVNGSETETITFTDDGPRLTVTPTAPGPVQVTVGRGLAGEANVHPGLDLAIEIQDGPRWQLTAYHPNGTPARGASILLDQGELGTTDQAGELTTEIPAEGRHRLAVLTAQGATVERMIQVDGWTVAGQEPQLTVVPTGLEAPPGLARMEVTLSTGDPIPVPATVTAEREGRIEAAAPLTVPAGGNASTELEVPVEAGGQHRFTVRAQGLESLALMVTNATQSSGTGGAGGGSAGDAAHAPPSMEAADDGVEASLEVQVGGPGGAEMAMTGPLEQAPETVPVRAEGALSDEAPSAETPALAPLVVLAVLVLAGALGRRRR